MIKKFVLLLGLIAPLMGLAMTQEDMANQYFSEDKGGLTKQEKKAVAIGREWQTGHKTSRPFVGKDGAIQFVYSTQQFQVVCAVLQVCDVALEPGEEVNNFNLGDPRFPVEPGVTNLEGVPQIHLLLQPLDVGLDTTLVVTTTKRTYHFRLRSKRHEFMPYVSFLYPENVHKKWAAMKHQKMVEKAQATIPETGEYLGHLNFNYKVWGNLRLKPARIYNDGVKTIIEMPYAIHQTEAPTLLVVRAHGGLFSKEETAIVNYRLQGNRYIVDSVFDRAILIVGAGQTQKRVTIQRG